MGKTILIADDDPHIREVISFSLVKAGMETILARDGKETLDKFLSHSPDLIILDIGMPEKDGLEVCREVRKISDVPILFLSARDDEIDKIVGLEIGGDDYVSKPFSPREIVARVNAILKRMLRPSAGVEGVEKVLSHGDVTLSSEKHQVLFKKQEIDLTSREFAMVEAFMRAPVRIFDRDRILLSVYDINMHVSDRTIDSHIRNIRKKFSDQGCVSIIETVHGVGFKLGTGK